MCAALPVTNVCREAEVLPQSGEMRSVTGDQIELRSIGAPSASAQICVTIVFDP